VIVFVHSSPTTLAPFRSPHLGVLCSPRRIYGAELAGWTWAADNDAFSEWSDERYRAMLERVRGREGLRFVTAPDVVGDAQETLARFWEWRDELLGVPLAFVLQDGATSREVPWTQLAAVFVGGKDDEQGNAIWKLGPQAAELVREAQARRKWVHMGRVNSHQRLRYAKALGCDSVDGSSFSWYRGDGAPRRSRDRDRLVRFLSHAAAPAQEMLA